MFLLVKLGFILALILLQLPVFCGVLLLHLLCLLLMLFLELLPSAFISLLLR